MGRYYENWIKGYMEYTLPSESPDQFHLWTAIATVAGALRRRVWIDEHIFQWTPNFYIVLVGPPGVAAKSTSIRQGLSLLEKTEMEIKFGPQSMTWQALTGALENAQEGVEIGPYDDIHLMSCLTIPVSELGTFLDPKNDELTSVLIDMWDGQQTIWRRETKSSGNTTITNPWLNVIACTTPSWIKSNMPANMIGGGLTSRILFVFGERKRHLVAFPSEAVEDEHFKKQQGHLVHDLREIAGLKGQYKRSKAATEWGVQWYANHYNGERPPHMQSERFDGYLARKQTHLFKLAIVLAAAKRNALTIELEDVLEADALLKDVEIDMARVFDSIGVTAGAAFSQELLSIIRSSKTIDYQRLWQIAAQTMSLKDFSESMRGLLQANFIKTKNEEGGKKTIIYVDQPTQ